MNYIALLFLNNANLLIKTFNLWIYFLLTNDKFQLVQAQFYPS